MQTRVGNVHNSKHVKSTKRELHNDSLYSMRRNATQLLSNIHPIRESEILSVLVFFFFLFH